MANINAPLGFQFRGTVSGPPSSVQMVKCYHASGDGTGLFIGDLVVSANTTDATTGLPIVTQAGNTGVPFGVVVGVNPIQGVAIGSENLNRVYCPASVGMYLDVIIDPNATFEIQSSGTVAGSDMGKYANILTTPVGSTVTGNSGMQMNEASVTGTLAGAQMLILQTIQDPSNAVSAANTRLLVKLVNHL